MAIIIKNSIKEDNVFVTTDEYNQYLQDYKNMCMSYVGTPVTLETYIKQRRNVQPFKYLRDKFKDK